MSDISQSLGFDVSNAIAGLNRLNAAIATHNTMLGNLRNAYSSFSVGNPFQPIHTALNGLNTATQNAANGAVGASQQINHAMNQLGGGAQNVNTFSNALNSLTGRLIFTNLLSNGVTEVRQAFAKAVKDAAAFQKQLALIQTISQDFQGNIDGLSRSLVSLSNEFNADLGDVANGLYQTISNQVQGASEQFRVLTAAIKLGKTTNATTEESVDLLTAAINGFGESSQDVEVIAAKMFRTIDLGRVVASELSNSLGRIAKQGSEVGASMDEVLASIATITLSGVKTSEAITQVRASFTGLIKPSDAMKEALRNLGFTSGQQAVQVLGFKGAIDALIGSANGSAAALGAMFPNVRNLAGVLNIAKTSGDQFAKTLNDIADSTASEQDTALNIVVETDAARATASLNKLKNFLTTEVGNAAIRTFNSMNDSAASFGQGLSSVGDQIESVLGVSPRLGSLETIFSGIIAAVPTATAAMIAYAAATRGAAIASNSLGIGAGALVSRLGAVGVVLGAAAASANAFSAAIDSVQIEARKNFDETIKQKIESIKLQDEIRIREEAETWKRVSALTRSGVGSQLQEYQKGAFKIQDASAALSENLSSAIEKVFEARKGVVDDLIRVSQQAEERAADAAQQSANVRIKADDQLFQRSLRNESQQAKFNKLIERSAELSKRAAASLSSAKTPDQRGRAESDFARAESLEQQAFAIAEQSNNARQLSISETRLKDLTDQRTRALANYAKTQKQLSLDADRQAKVQFEAVRKLQERFSTLGEGPKALDEAGNLLPADVRAKNLDDFNKMFKSFQSEALNLGLDLGGFIDLQRFYSELNRSLSAGEISALKFGDKAFTGLDAALQNQIDSFMQDAKVSLLVDLIFQSSGKTVSDPAKLFEELDLTSKNSGAASKIQSQIKQAQTNAEGLIKGSIAGIEVALSNGDGYFSGLGIQTQDLIEDFQQDVKRILGGDPFGGGQDIATNPFNEAFASIKSAGEDAIITLEEFADVQAKVNAAVKAFNSPENTSDKTVRQSAVKALQSALSSITQAKEAQNQIQALQVELEGLNVDGLQNGFKAAKEQLEKMNVEAGSLNNTLGQISPSVSDGVSLATSKFVEWNNAADAVLQKVNQIASATSKIEIKVDDGTRKESKKTTKDSRQKKAETTTTTTTIYRASGGVARGSDNINAVLSRGEFVVNARNYRRFAPEVTAINAGIRPTYRNSGGAVSQVTNVGDIYVNVDGSTGSTNMGRSAALQLRREIRRGTSRI